MAVKRTDRQATIWPLEPHTAAKHDLLRAYLGAWFAVLGSRNSRVIFLDGFAGPGRYESGEDGSPTIALQVLLEHGYLAKMSGTQFVFVFNEQDAQRFAELQLVIEDLKRNYQGLPSNVAVHLSNQPFVDLAEDMLSGLGGRAMAPIFAFIDPFGYGAPMDVVRRLLASDRSELFIYFNTNHIKRFSGARKIDHHLEPLFGTDEYLLAPSSGREQFLHDLYARQLREVAQFRYVRSFAMENYGGHTSYHLYFCTNHIAGLKKMKAAMWKVAPSGDYRFRDRTAGQAVLFDAEPDREFLANEITKFFAGRAASVEEVSDFVAEHTSFTDSHFKRPLKALQHAGRISVPKQNRFGTFPAGTMIQF